MDFVWLAATSLVMASVLIALSIRFMPHHVAHAFGVPRSAGSGCCSSLLPVWAQWGIWSVSSLLLLMLLIGGGLSAVSGIRAMVKTRRFVLARGRVLTAEERGLAGGSPAHGFKGEPVLVMDEVGTFAFTVGLLRPRTVISADLLGDLDPREFQAVMAHEAAHAAGCDNLILLVARAATRSVWLLPGVELVHRRLRQNIELAADSHARAEMGDGLVVASSLHRFATLLRNRSDRFPLDASPVLAWFAGDNSIMERVGRLLDESERRVSRLRVRLAFVALVAAFLVFAGGTYQVASQSLELGAHGEVCEESAPVSEVFLF